MIGFDYSQTAVTNALGQESGIVYFATAVFGYHVRKLLTRAILWLIANQLALQNILLTQIWAFAH